MKKTEKTITMYQKAEEDLNIVRRRFHFAKYVIGRCFRDTQKDKLPEEKAVSGIFTKVSKFLRKEEYDVAAKVLAQAINQYPDSQDLMGALCGLLIEADQYVEAERILKGRSEKFKDLHHFELLANLLVREEKYDRLEKELETASSLGYRSAALFNAHGILSHRMGNDRRAICYFNQAIKMEPEYSPAFANGGLLKIDNGDVNEGLSMLEKGVFKAPCDYTVLEAYHSVVSKLDKYRKAEPLFRTALKEYPDCKKLAYLYIDILLQQEKYVEAMQVVEQAIAKFGVADGILSPALTIRQKIGSPDIQSNSNGNRISLCMIVKNEELNLAKALWSVKGLVDEFVIVDTGSNDQTKKIAQVFGARVYDYVWNNNFAQARNASLEKARGDWVLILDADEQISPKDHLVIRQMVSNVKRQDDVAFAFTTRNYVVDVGVEGWNANKGQYHEEKGDGWYPSIKVRLFPNKNTIRFENGIHEKVEEGLERQQFEILHLDIPIHHFGEVSNLNKRAKKASYYKMGQDKFSARKYDLSAAIEHAIQAGETGRYREALRLWKEILGKKTDYAKGFFNLGFVYIQLGQYKNGKRVSQKALELDPELKEAYLNLSLCEMRIGNNRSAITILETFISQYPEHPMAIGNLGVAYCLSGQNGKGMQNLHRIAEMGYNSREFVEQHAEALKSIGNNNAALRLLTVPLHF